MWIVSGSNAFTYISVVWLKSDCANSFSKCPRRAKALFGLRGAFQGFAAAARGRRLTARATRLWFICLCKSTEWLTQQKRDAVKASNQTQMSRLFFTPFSPRKAMGDMRPCSTVSCPARYVCRGEMAAPQIQADSRGSPGGGVGDLGGWLSGISLSRWRTVADKVMMNTFHLKGRRLDFSSCLNPKEKWARAPKVENPRGAKIQRDFTSQEVPSCCT